MNLLLLLPRNALRSVTNSTRYIREIRDMGAGCYFRKLTPKSPASFLDPPPFILPFRDWKIDWARIWGKKEEEGGNGKSSVKFGAEIA